MEMENTRRSTAIDRSRQLSSLKKPRIDAETPILRAPNSTVRFRDERDDDSIRERERGGGGGGGSSSSNLSSYQQQQELVSQYRTALSELTFNSKPIITNLTIIAGENLLAAKGIAAAICNNVLEVPSDQKLPSLYLLDSIVKNIGRDYIKHFAARLPEVFCRAYKQVNSTLHPSMRHLFSTWRGVFPSTPLQMIEKELGFSPVVKNSSGTGASRSESQPQRPATSIHVNPKYLEARQRLQQSARSKEVDSDSGDEIVPSIDNAERLDRTAMAGNKRQWTDLSSKIPNIQRPQRELSNDPIFEKKGFRDIKTNESSSVLSPSRHTDLGLGRATDRIKERDEVDKSYYRDGGTVSETVTNRGNGFDANHTQGTYRASGFAQTDCEQPIIHLNNLNKGIHPAPKNWKNSEEEEYMWDDMNSKLTGYGGSNRSVKGSWNIETADRSVNMQRGHLIPPETEQPDFHRDKFDTFPHLMAPGGEDRVPLFRDIDEHRLLPLRKPDADPRLKAASVHHASSLWPREQILSDASHNLTNSRNSGQPEGRVISLGSVSSASLISPFPRPGPPIHSHPSSLSPSEIVASGPTGILGQQRQQHMHPPSPPSDLPPSYVPIHLHQKLQNTVDHDRSQSLFSQMPLPGHLSTPPHAPAAIDSPYLAQNPSLQLIPPHSSQPLSLPFSQLRHPPPPFLSQTQRDLPLQPAPAHIQAEKSPDVSGQSNTAHLLAALMKSGILPSNPSSGLQNFNIQPPLPSGPPPIQALTSSGPLVTPSSLPIQTTQGTGAVLPPLPPGPPPPSSKKSSTTSMAPNSFSSLLSSLVAKGIISSPAPEMPAATSVQIPNKVMEPRTELSSSASLLVHSTSDISTIHSSLPKEPFVLEPSHATGVPLLTAPNTMKMELLIHSTSDTSTIHSSLPKQPFVSEPSHATGVPLLTAPSTTEMEELIGIDFKPEIVREVHSSVINSLFDDLKHQCGTCGLRFKFQEQLSSHSDLHVSEKSLPSSSDEVSRKWYSNSSNWLVRKMELSKLPVSSDSLDDVVPITEACEPMVPADYSQCICALCGEPFEDYYSHDRDEWMYKGTVFLNSSEGKGDVGSMDDVKLQNFIVHTKCKSNSADNKDVSEGDTVDWRDG